MAFEYVLVPQALFTAERAFRRHFLFLVKPTSLLVRVQFSVLSIFTNMYNYCQVLNKYLRILLASDKHICLFAETPVKQNKRENARGKPETP